MDSQTKEHPHIPSVKLIFISEEPEFVEATNEYKNLWEANKEKIVTALEANTGLLFWQKQIQVKVYDGVSNSGYKLGDPISLFFDFDREFKLATLIHELGHRILLINLKSLPEGYDPEQLLDLFLYDVWTDIYGEEFAKRQVAKESNDQRKKVYDFEKTWNWALSMTREKRQELLNKLLSKALEGGKEY